MEKALVSVIVPVYKVEQYLDRCINSIVNQTYTDLEIILVDDGSPDNCPQMCDEWASKDNRIRVIHKENAGLGMARNTGIENATGVYICFFDSDDYIALDTVEKACRLAEEERAEIVIFGMSSVDRHGKIRHNLVPDSPKRCFQGDEVQEIFLPDLVDAKRNDTVIKNLCLSACCCLFSMDLVRKTGWRFVSERENISEDSYSLIWLYKYVSKVAILPEALYFHFVNEESLSRTYRFDRFEKIKQFYLDTVTMAREQGYNEKVQQGIAGLFLSFSVGAMKQIVASNMKYKDKKRMIMQIIHDDLMQRILHSTPYKTYGKAREVLFWGIRRKLFHMCYLLLEVQNTVGKI